MESIARSLWIPILIASACVLLTTRAEGPGKDSSVGGGSTKSDAPASTSTSQEVRREGTIVFGLTGNVRGEVFPVG